MADTATSYRIWQSPEGVLIQAGASAIELSVADALALAADIKARLDPPFQKPQWSRMKRTPELLAECARLYLDEKLGTIRIATRLGISRGMIQRCLRQANVQMRAGKVSNDTLIRARAALAAKRARRAA